MAHRCKYHRRWTGFKGLVQKICSFLHKVRSTGKLMLSEKDLKRITLNGYSSLTARPYCCFRTSTQWEVRNGDGSWRRVKNVNCSDILGIGHASAIDLTNYAKSKTSLQWHGMFRLSWFVIKLHVFLIVHLELTIQGLPGGMCNTSGECSLC